MSHNTVAEIYLYIVIAYIYRTVHAVAGCYMRGLVNYTCYAARICVGCKFVVGGNAVA